MSPTVFASASWRPSVSRRSKATRTDSGPVLRRALRNPHNENCLTLNKGWWSCTNPSSPFT